jgi:hypothetical protein
MLTKYDLGIVQTEINNCFFLDTIRELGIIQEEEEREAMESMGGVGEGKMEYLDSGDLQGEGREAKGAGQGVAMLIDVSVLLYACIM